MNKLAVVQTSSALVKTTPSLLAVKTEGDLERRDIVSRNLTIANNHVFDDVISRFAFYVDPEGNPASSPGGLKKAINTKIMKAYGTKREDMTGLQNIHCACLLGYLANHYSMGMANNDLRSVIRETSYPIIELFGKQYHQINELINGQRD
jgi:hypothetical protein